MARLGYGRAGILALGALIVAVWLLAALPLATGQRTLFFRDVLDNHFALKAFGAAELARGEIPAFDPTLGLGQPFRGNPSALAFYPDNVLYRLLPFWSAFNLHFALHWLLALVAMAVLARRLGLGPAATMLAALTYAGCGFTLSTLSFYNLVTVAAWWPLAMAGAMAGGSGGIALGGAACGLALLGGEPLTTALGLAPMLLAAARRHGLRRGFAATFGVGAIGCLVAAPQLVATWRILGFSLRGTTGVSSLATHFSLPPLRLLELLLPLPFGWPLDVGPQGWWLGRSSPHIGFYLSLYGGVVALWLALRGARRRPGWAALAVAGLAGSILLAAVPDLLREVTGGLFRYPEKLLVWYALALPILAGQGLDDALSRPRETFRARPAVIAGALLLLAAPVLLFAWPRLVDPTAMPAFATVQAAHWVVYLALGGVLLLLAVLAVRRRAGAAVVALQLVALLQLYPLLRTAPTAPLSTPGPWQQRLGVAAVGQGKAVVNTLISRPTWEPPPPYRVEPGTRAANHLRNALDLYPAPGIRFGLTYPLAPNIEGLASPLYTFLAFQVARMPWEQRMPWLRAVGLDAVVAYTDPGVDGLTLLDAQVRQGVLSRLYAVDRPAPKVWWPRRVEAARGPREVLARVSALADPVATVIASSPVEHDPRGSVRLLSERPDRIELGVASRGGGLAVVRRSYHTLFRAHLDDGDGGASGGGRGAVKLLPVQLTLLGVEVPPGEHRVVIDVDDTPEVVAGGVAVATLLALLFVAWRSRHRIPQAPRAPRAPRAPQASQAPQAPQAPGEPTSDATGAAEEEPA